MIGKYKVITLCGSTKFKEQFLEVQKRLTLEGNIVISVGLFGHSGDDEAWTEGTKEMLDDMHKRKIDMADAIFVINVNGYIGDSTLSEIKYAKMRGKEIIYFEPTLKATIEDNKLDCCPHCKQIVSYDFKDFSKVDKEIEYDKCIYTDGGYGDDDRFADVEYAVFYKKCPYCSNDYLVNKIFLRKLKEYDREGNQY